jgi:proteic killer suppression protein
MIRGFRHKGLRLLFEAGERRRLNPDLVDKTERVLARLDNADEVTDMALPGFRLHELKGQRAGTWAVTISGNWRLVFRFEDGHATDVDLVDYH